MNDNPSTRIYKNDGNGAFSEFENDQLEDFGYGVIEIEDLNSDTYADLLISGWGNSGLVVRTYLNDGSGLFENVVNEDILAVWLGDAEFLDLDEDGDLDLLICGVLNFDWEPSSRLYENDGNNRFSWDSDVIFDPVYHGSITTSDIELDGDIDVLISGGVGSNLYLNQGDLNFVYGDDTQFADIRYGEADFGDLDGDGDDDLLMGGVGSFFNFVSSVYENIVGDSFILSNDFGVNGGAEQGRAKMIDLDSDGDLDISFSSHALGGSETRLYENISNEFSFVLNHEIEISEIITYPNPVTSNYVNIEFNSSQNFKTDYEIYDVLGRVIMKKDLKINSGINHNRINLVDQQSGIYFLKLGGMNGKVVRIVLN